MISTRVPGPWLVVGATVAWCLLSLRAETATVPYLDDSSIHEQMVRFATLRIQGGHLPLTSWFPYLGLGSPQFLHYQPLGSMLAGAAGLVLGPDAAFHWALYLLMCAWPVSVYASGRLFGLPRWGAAASAALSPFVMSAVGVGYEQPAYLWIGYGVWTQLWASVTLPLAWGLSWRAIRDGRSFLLAGAAVAVTIALHFETGYLALLPLAVWPFVSRAPLAPRIGRAALLATGSLLASAWVIVPLIAERNWAATNEALQRTRLVNGYGAGRVLSWLASGQVLDAGRLPVITVLAGLGLALALARWRSDVAGRAIFVALVVCLLLSFGRTTFGTLIAAVPGSGDVFFRRFMMGAELAGLLLAGVGAEWLGRAAFAAVRRAAARWPRLDGALLGRVCIGAGAALVLLPAALQLLSFDRRNAAAIAAQERADRSQGDQVDRLVAIVRRAGEGRVYAGMGDNWGARFRVGAVPVFKYLESRDVDEVGYTLRTASLMTGPELHFNERVAGDYSLFGIRFLILPRGGGLPVPSRLKMCSGAYCLWETRTAGYVEAGTVVGSLAADRSNVGSRSALLLRSHLPGEEAYLRLRFGSAASSTPLPAVPRPFVPGRPVAEQAALDRGEAAAVLTMRRPGIAVLSSSFDAGWTATVDGRKTAIFPVSPALTATSVPAGVHRVSFRYEGFPYYAPLFVLCGLSLAALGAIDRRRRQSNPREDICKEG